MVYIRKNALYDICFRGFDSLRIKDFIYYDNCLCMKRKKDLFLEKLKQFGAYGVEEDKEKKQEE